MTRVVALEGYLCVTGVLVCDWVLVCDSDSCVHMGCCLRGEVVCDRDTCMRQGCLCVTGVIALEGQLCVVQEREIVWLGL